MTTLKTLTMVAALLAGGTSLALAQGPATGGEPPVAGGANGNPILNKQQSAPRHQRSTYMYAHPPVFKYKLNKNKKQ
jgi:hypothetical protein